MTSVRVRRLVPGTTMTPTEYAASLWLERQGYERAGIRFQYHTSPDFLTADGLGWEVKRIDGRSVVFSLHQAVGFERHGAVNVLFMRDGDQEPFLVAPFADLSMPGDWSGLRLVVQHQPRYSLGFPVPADYFKAWTEAARNEADPVEFVSRITRKDMELSRTPVVA